MAIRYLLLIGIILGIGSGCQNTLVTESQPLPTLLELPSQTAAPTTTPTATITPTVTPSATITDTPTPTLSPTPGPSATPSRTPIPSPTLAPSITRTPLPETFIFGKSAGGRDLVAHRVGTGGTIIFLVGGIHAGFESNTIDLVNAMVNHFRSTPGDVLPGITLILVPALNPDGQARGRVVDGRFNGNDVDLNRNWGCGWSADAQWRLGSVNPGPQPFSEPETQALASLVERTAPAVVIFYHGAVNGVFAGDCAETGDTPSFELARVYGDASNYPYGGPFNEYELTGTAPNWFDSQGIPSVDVELASPDLPETARNIRGVVAIQAWVLSPGR